MGQQVSVETFTSTKDPDGNKYWTSFDPYPFKVGSKKLVYMGILNGEGPLKGQKCVVKTVRNGAISRQDWSLESKRAKVARSIANSYNKSISRQDRQFTFNFPIMAEIDTLSDCLCINDILGKPKKKWNDSEYVSIELYLRGRFEEFEYGWVSPKELVETEAFSHFSWCKSEGNMLISNLQGVKTSQAYHLTGPVIHSEGIDFGSSDLGHKGIKGFFKLHECNKICRSWPKLGDGADLSGFGEYIKFGQRLPSAPPLLPTYNFSPPPYSEVESGTPAYASHDERESLLDEEEMRLQHAQSHTTNCQRQMDYNESFSTPRIIESGWTERSQQWQSRDGRHLYMDWQEGFINQTMGYDSRFGQYNEVLHNEMLGNQLLWIVKQMRYTVYAAPPPYCTSAHQRNEIAHQNCARTPDIDEKERLLDDDNANYLLPPPYEEESVDPELECVTYL